MNNRKKQLVGVSIAVAIALALSLFVYFSISLKKSDKKSSKSFKGKHTKESHVEASSLDYSKILQSDSLSKQSIEIISSVLSEECASKRDELLYSLRTHFDVNFTQGLFIEAKQSCEWSVDFFDFLLSLFNKTEGKASKEPQDISDILAFKANLEALKTDWKVDLCEKYNQKFLNAFNAFHADPEDAENGLEAYHMFPLAKTFCPSNDLLESFSLTCFLKRKIISLLEAEIEDEKETMKYVRMYRQLRPGAFSECSNVVEIKESFRKDKFEFSDITVRPLEEEKTIELLVSNKNALEEAGRLNKNEILVANYELLESLAEEGKTRKGFYMRIAPLLSAAYQQDKDLLSLIDDLQEWSSVSPVGLELFPQNHHAAELLQLRMYLSAEQVLEILDRLNCDYELDLSEYDRLEATSDAEPRKVVNRNGICYAISVYQCLSVFHPLLKKYAPEDRKAKSLLAILKHLNERTSEPFDLNEHTRLKSTGVSSHFAAQLFESVLSSDPKWRKLMSGGMRCDFDLFPKDADGEKSAGSQTSLGPILVVEHIKGISPPLEFVPVGCYSTYELVSVSLSTGGHYLSLVKRGGQWYSCDDESVRCIEEFAIPKNTEPLVSFYVQK